MDNFTSKGLKSSLFNIGKKVFNFFKLKVDGEIQDEDNNFGKKTVRKDEEDEKKFLNIKRQPDFFFDNKSLNNDKISVSSENCSVNKLNFLSNFNGNEKKKPLNWSSISIINENPQEENKIRNDFPRKNSSTRLKTKALFQNRKRTNASNKSINENLFKEIFLSRKKKIEDYYKNKKRNSKSITVFIDKDNAKDTQFENLKPMQSSEIQFENDKPSAQSNIENTLFEGDKNINNNNWILFNLNNDDNNISEKEPSLFTKETSKRQREKNKKVKKSDGATLPSSDDSGLFSQIPITFGDDDDNFMKEHNKNSRKRRKIESETKNTKIINLFDTHILKDPSFFQNDTSLFS